MQVAAVVPFGVGATVTHGTAEIAIASPGNQRSVRARVRMPARGKQTAKVIDDSCWNRRSDDREMGNGKFVGSCGRGRR